MFSLEQDKVPANVQPLWRGTGPGQDREYDVAAGTGFRNGHHLIEDKASCDHHKKRVSTTNVTRPLCPRDPKKI